MIMAVQTLQNPLTFLLVLVPVLVGLLWISVDIAEEWIWLQSDDQGHGPEYQNACFTLNKSHYCHPLLNCNEINKEITQKEVIGRGAVKLVKRGVWQNHDIAVNLLSIPAYKEDFLHGVHMLRQLQTSVNVTRLIGSCERDYVFVTEYHRLGSANNLESIFLQERFAALNSLSVRFSLCMQYTAILQSLHTRPEGARVMCDSNDLNKTLSQFLLRDDLTLVLNDVDALPLANRNRGQLVKCGHRELFGEFVAPEQLWPHEDRDFNDSEMMGYDEKVDIWKVPDVCDALIGQVQGSARLRLHLLHKHLDCKNESPIERPSAQELLELYRHVHDKLHL